MRGSDILVGCSMDTRTIRADLVPCYGLVVAVIDVVVRIYLCLNCFTKHTICYKTLFTKSFVWTSILLTCFTFII